MANKTTNETANDPAALAANVAQALKIKETELKAKAQGSAASRKNLILQTIPLGKDTKDVIRRYTELTPSMCQMRGCGFDAIKEMGIAAGWNAAPLDTRIDAAGTTLGEKAKEILALHVNAAHSQPTLDHIISEDDLKGRGEWAPGQGLKIV